VVANVALHNMGKQKGDYSVINPNDHVNLCQSTNDFYPSAAKLAVVGPGRNCPPFRRHAFWTLVS
jgi:aspartate ammonia-lyase